MVWLFIVLSLLCIITVVLVMPFIMTKLGKPYPTPPAPPAPQWGFWQKMWQNSVASLCAAGGAAAVLALIFTVSFVIPGMGAIRSSYFFWIWMILAVTFAGLLASKWGAKIYLGSFLVLAICFFTINLLQSRGVIDDDRTLTPEEVHAKELKAADDRHARELAELKSQIASLGKHGSPDPTVGATKAPTTAGVTPPSDPTKLAKPGEKLIKVPPAKEGKTGWIQIANATMPGKVRWNMSNGLPKVHIFLNGDDSKSYLFPAPAGKEKENMITTGITTLRLQSESDVEGSELHIWYE